MASLATMTMTRHTPHSPSDPRYLEDTMKGSVDRGRIDPLRAAIILVMVSGCLACDRNPVDTFCHDWLATNEQHQAKTQADREAEKTKADAMVAEVVDPRH